MIKGTLASYTQDELNQKVKATVELYMRKNNSNLDHHDKYLEIAFRTEKQLSRTLAIMNMQWHIYSALTAFDNKQ